MRGYTSGLIVEFERAAESSLDKLNQINKLLSDAIHSAYGWTYEYNLQRLAFAVDPKLLPQFRQTQFYIERRLNTPYADNRYYSGAPLSTEEHIKLLETIERDLLAK
jgi:hypothetical protein